MALEGVPVHAAAKGRSARIAAGLGANGVTQASQLVMRLVEVPVLLALWGAAGYGEWLLIAALPTALSFSDGGFTRTARREMAMRAGRGDDDGIVAVFQSAWVLLLALSATVTLLLTLLLPHIPLAQWLSLKSVDDTHLDVALMALAAQVLIYFQCGLLHGAFTCRGRYAIGELLIALSTVLCFCGMLIGASFGKGIAGAAIGSLVGQIAGYGAMWAVHVRQVPGPRYGIGRVTRTEVQALWTPSVASLAFPMGEALNAQGTRLVVGLSLGPASLAMFSTMRTLCRLALQPVMSIARTVEPELSLASSRQQASRELFLLASHAGAWCSMALAVGVAIAGPMFYARWTGRALPLDQIALCLLLVSSLLGVLWGVALTVPCSVNRHASISLPLLIAYGAGTTSLVWVLTHLGMRLSGAALAVLAGDVMALALVVPAALNIADASVIEWLRAIFRSPAELFTLVRTRARALLMGRTRVAK